MSLTSRQLFDLSVILNSLYDRTEAASNAAALATRASVNINNLVTANLPSRNVWESFLQLADEQHKVIKVLEYVANEPGKGDNLMLPVWISELQQGFNRRIQLMAEVLRAGKCVLFLGPGMLQFRHDKQAPALFSQVLAERLAKDIEGQVYFDSNVRTNLNYMAQRYMEQPKVLLEDLGLRAKVFYEESLQQGRIEVKFHEQLANLPFRVIINVNPDNLLVEQINQRTPGRCAQRYYSVANSPEEHLTVPTRPVESVLHYNIFGAFDNPSSILFTESHLLDFTKRILRRDPPLDPAILREFDETKSYLFLGFDFEQWNMKIVFDMVLQLVKKTDRAFSIFPSSVSVGTFNREFFEREFQMYFIQEDLNVFLAALTNACFPHN